MREGFALLVVMLLVLRGVVMPMIMTGPEPNMIAFCLNGQIVYATWDGEPPGEASEIVDPCPFAGVVAAIDISEPGIDTPWRALEASERPEAAILLSTRAAFRVYRSRAPPLAI